MAMTTVKGNAKMCKCCGAILVMPTYTLMGEEGLEIIMQEVENITKVHRTEMGTKRGKETVMLARHLFHILAFNYTICDHSRISKETGKDRTTVSCSIKISTDLLRTDAWFSRNYRRIAEIIEKKATINAA